MTPAEHRAKAEQLLSAASYFTSNPAEDLDAESVVREAELLTAQAQAYATLALAPAPTPPPRPKPKPAARVEVFDVELNHLTVTSVGSAGMDSTGAVVLDHPATDWSTLLDDPAQVRLLADTLTAHADRMENRT